MPEGCACPKNRPAMSFFAAAKTRGRAVLSGIRYRMPRAIFIIL